jgi:hypothetical protein
MSVSAVASTRIGSPGDAEALGTPVVVDRARLTVAPRRAGTGIQQHADDGEVEVRAQALCIRPALQSAIELALAVHPSRGEMSPAAVIGNVELPITTPRDVGDCTRRGGQLRPIDAEMVRVARFDGARDVAAALADRARRQELDRRRRCDAQHHSDRPLVAIRCSAFGTSPSVK